METTKITFELSKNYIRGILAILGAEKEIPQVMDTIGDDYKVDIDKISELSEDLAQMKTALVAMIMCQVGMEKGI